MFFDTTSILTILHSKLDGFFSFFMEDHELD
jgi:hypothetical protein